MRATSEGCCEFGGAHEPKPTATEDTSGGRSLRQAARLRLGTPRNGEAAILSCMLGGGDWRTNLR